jgi:hypothetical protein
MSRPRYAIVGEYLSDASTLKVLVRRLAERATDSQHANGLQVSTRGYEGASEMFKHAARDLAIYAKLGCNRFIVAHDSDADLPASRRERVMDEIIKPSKIGKHYCILIPVQEIEAWILADLPAIQRLHTSWKPTKQFSSPEQIGDPKERLESLVKHPKTKRRLYNHVTDNERVAEYLDLETVATKCRSFHGLVEFVTGKTINHICPRRAGRTPYRKQRKK